MTRKWFTAVARSVTVNVPIEHAWHHFNDASKWPRWHAAVTAVDVMPPGEIGAQSVAVMRAPSGRDTTFRVNAFVPYQHWAWEMKILWLTLRIDHQFEAVDGNRTRINLVTQVSGVGKALFGRLVAGQTARSLDEDLPKLAREMDALTAASI